MSSLEVRLCFSYLSLQCSLMRGQPDILTDKFIKSALHCYSNCQAIQTNIRNREQAKQRGSSLCRL